MNVKNVRLDQIDVGSRFRALDLTKVESLKQSIKDSGLINPITVFPGAEEGRYKLAAGAHRLQALDDLGWETVDVHVIAGDDDHRRLVELEENLVRAELTPVDLAYAQCKHKELWVRTRKAAGKPVRMPRRADIMPANQDLRSDAGSVAELTSALANTNHDPELPVIGDLDDPDIIDDGSDPRAGYATQTSHITKQSKRDINRNIRRGRILGKEAVAKIRHTCLDVGTQLDALCRLAEDLRADLIDRVYAGEVVDATAYLPHDMQVVLASRRVLRGMAKCATRVSAATFANVVMTAGVEVNRGMADLARAMADEMEQRVAAAEDEARVAGETL